MKENAVEHLKARRWKEFLMAVPLDKPKGYHVENANDIYILRVRASQLSNAKECDRTFSITTDFDTRIVTVTSKLKDNENSGNDPTGSTGD